MGDSERDLSFMNGVPELLILQLLDRREMYGYELVEAIKVETGSVIAVGEGCVYPILHALERKKMLRSRRMEKDGRSRVYYALTPGGRKRLDQTISHWTTLTAAVNAVIAGVGHGKAATAG